MTLTPSTFVVVSLEGLMAVSSSITSMAIESVVPHGLLAIEGHVRNYVGVAVALADGSDFNPALFTVTTE